jgi:hypothetical protein
VAQNHASVASGQPVENPFRPRLTAVVYDYKITESETREAFDRFEEAGARIEGGDQNHDLWDVGDLVHQSLKCYNLHLDMIVVGLPF